jgi:hypothetical protein
MELGIRSSIMRNTPTARSSTRIAPHGGELRHDLQGLTLQPLPVVTGRAGRIGLGPATLCESGPLAGSSTRSRFAALASLRGVTEHELAEPSSEPPPPPNLDSAIREGANSFSNAFSLTRPNSQR